MTQAVYIIYIYYTGLRFWYTDPSAVDKCGLMTYNERRRQHKLYNAIILFMTINYA
jgi:hypothetical protein